MMDEHGLSIQVCKTPKNCRPHVHVDTYSFEAIPFYERLGYELFATLEDYPPGYCKYFFKKRLVELSSDSYREAS